MALYAGVVEQWKRQLWFLKRLRFYFLPITGFVLSQGVWNIELYNFIITLIQDV